MMEVPLPGPYPAIFGEEQVAVQVKEVPATCDKRLRFVELPPHKD
jgi:hypothetical protein